MPKMIQVGVMGIRNPANRYEIMKNIPLYEELTEELQTNEETMLRDAGKLFAKKMKQYIDGGGLIERRGRKKGEK